jgi:hypothetical protein
MQRLEGLHADWSSLGRTSRADGPLSLAGYDMRFAYGFFLESATLATTPEEKAYVRNHYCKQIEFLRTQMQPGDEAILEHTPLYSPVTLLPPVADRRKAGFDVSFLRDFCTNTT